MTSARDIIRQLYRLVDKLERKHPGRHFTPDGHLVGSLGEAYAEEQYDLTLLPSSAKTHDAKRGNMYVQIKTTQTDRIAISSEPDHLLVLKLHRNGTFEEIYFGSGAPVWTVVKHKKRPKNGQYQISLTKLRKVQNQ